MAISMDDDDHKYMSDDLEESPQYVMGSNDVDVAQIYESNMIEQLKNKVLKLEEWKKEIALPALTENQSLRATIAELEQSETLQTAQLLALKQENQTLQMQVDEFNDDHNQLQIERTVLLSQLDEVESEREASQKEEAEWVETVTEQYRKIDKLVRHRRKSVNDLQLSQTKIAELLQENSALSARVDELKLLHDKSQRAIQELNEKLTGMHTQNEELAQANQALLHQLSIEREKAQNLYHQFISTQLSDYAESKDVKRVNVGIHEAEAIPVALKSASVGSHATHSSNREMLEDRLSNGSVSPINLSRRRSRSFDSDQCIDKYVMHHTDADTAHFDHEVHDVDLMEEQKERIRQEVHQELSSKFDFERKELNDKYDTLHRKYIATKSRLDQFDKKASREEEKREVDMILSRRSREEMHREKELSNCWMFPWGTCR